jgi:hypothetical protein
MTNHVVLTESQMSLLHVALDVARDKFRDNARMLDARSLAGHLEGLADQFEKQAEQTDELLTLLVNSDHVTFSGEEE